MGLGVALLGLPQSAKAVAIFAGTDYVVTPSGGGQMTVPGFGLVSFGGLPINTGVSQADTIINRTQDVPETGGTTPLEIVGLSLQALKVQSNGLEFDFFAGLQSYKGGAASTGTMTIRHENADTPMDPDTGLPMLDPNTGLPINPTQGTWDSSFTINGTIVIVPTGTLDSNGQVDFVEGLVADCGISAYTCVDFSQGPFVASNATWSHEALIGQITGPNLVVPGQPNNFYIAGEVNHVDPSNGGQHAHFITPVPWETDALSVIGSTVLFGFGLWAKSKSAKSNKNVDLD